PRLGDRQGTGQAVHAATAPPGRLAGPTGDPLPLGELYNRGEISLEAAVPSEHVIEQSLPPQGVIRELGDYQRPGWRRLFFEYYRDSRKWQGLEPFQKSAKMTEVHCFQKPNFSLCIPPGIFRSASSLRKTWRPATPSAIADTPPASS